MNIKTITPDEAMKIRETEIKSHVIKILNDNEKELRKTKIAPMYAYGMILDKHLSKEDKDYLNLLDEGDANFLLLDASVESGIFESDKCHIWLKEK